MSEAVTVVSSARVSNIFPLYPKLTIFSLMTMISFSGSAKSLSFFDYFDGSVISDSDSAFILSALSITTSLPGA